ncbi:hypothetical protein L198_07373 [Cryptococcus wingfieldii CBS 7118]|uniref:BZIP domain-containing protein n=1 Tax=Cryptococcus wingfieldii CBS 7118 TaxID=1295528 RepID=A0A1E3IBV5_9TREE|nr:hypothetical protein L198_07373 [Cryptococcus wingfieldii CBS 7118]ODN86080.1 hypothetical protein L198_07373 [Cryptococcus wingfieldii CBS 7118]
MGELTKEEQHRLRIHNREKSQRARDKKKNEALAAAQNTKSASTRQKSGNADEPLDGTEDDFASLVDFEDNPEYVPLSPEEMDALGADFGEICWDKNFQSQQ